MFKKIFLVFLLVLLFNKSLFSQCGISVTSTNGWTADISYAVTGIVVTTGATCQWYYQYGAVVTYTVNFSGSSTSRSITLQNMCVGCKDGAHGSCKNCVSSVGTFVANTVGTVTVSNNSCEYDASSAYNYGSNPSCTTISLANAGCTSAQVDVSGNGVSYTSNIPCAGILPVPIELINFNATLSYNKVYLNWTTATETNNKYFTLEKSNDAISFEEVLRVSGSGNSTQTKNYSAIDANPFVGTSYYRLKQTDYNGDYKYSVLTLVENKNEQLLISNLYPNPTSETISFDLYATEKGTIQIQFIDNMGRIVLDNLQDIKDKQSKINVQTNLLSQGIYTLKVSQLETGISSVSKFIKN